MNASYNLLGNLGAISFDGIPQGSRNFLAVFIFSLSAIPQFVLGFNGTWFDKNKGLKNDFPFISPWRPHLRKLSFEKVITLFLKKHSMVII